MHHWYFDTGTSSPERWVTQT